MDSQVSHTTPFTSFATLHWPWHYAETSKRDLRLDFMRGFAILALAVNHLLVSNSLFYSITGNAMFIVSAAELFYAVSGIVVGVISARQPLETAIRRTLRRGFELYLVAVSLAVFFLAIGWLTNLRL